MTASELESGVKSGCSVCPLFSDIIQKAIPVKDGARYRQDQYNGHTACSVRLGLEPLGESMLAHSLHIKTLPSATFTGGYRDFVVSTAADNAASAYTSKRHAIKADSSAPETYKRIQDWIHECCYSHEDCPDSDGCEMPTRSLEICEDAFDHTLRLKLRNTKGRTGRYVALSYAWGRQIEFQTTRASIYTMEQGFRIAAMPQTLQDAVKVTHELGIAFLWIDSLCIIQDSDEDKLLEISNMGNVYTKAFLTISATNANHAYEGFLRNHRRQGEIIEIPYLCPKGTIGTICLRPAGWFNARREPLNRRAWAFQERLLSPRLLDYTSLHVSWKCRTAKHDRTDHEGRDFDGSQYADKVSLIMNLVNGRVQPRLREEEILEIWGWILEEFTWRNLTVKTDKLPAIAGIAAYLQRALGDEYCGGLWRRHLPRSLLWTGSRHAHSNDVKYGRPIARLSAPSWSWAAMDRLVKSKHTWNYADCDWTLQIIDCDVTLALPNDPFATVTGGTLTVRACLGLAQFQGYVFQSMRGIALNGARALAMPDDAEEWEQCTREGVICLEVLREKDKSKAVWQSFGLCLARQENGRYKRIGCFEENLESKQGLKRDMFGDCEPVELKII